MSDRDDSGAPRLRVDRLAAAMDAARARARAAAESPAPQTAAVTPKDRPQPTPPAQPVGHAHSGPVRAGTADALAMPGPPDPQQEPGDPVAGGQEPEAGGIDAHALAVRDAQSGLPSAPLLLTDDLRIEDARPENADDTMPPSEECDPATGPATVAVSSAKPKTPPGAEAALGPVLLSLSGVATETGRKHVLQDVTFDVPKGAVTLLLGRRGAGKTTVLRTVVGLQRARAGEIVLAGDRIDRWPSHRIARAGVGYVPQTMSIFTDLTVAENITLGARSGPVPRDRMDWLTGLFPPLATLWRSPAGTLTDGQKRILALARALVERRRLYLIDEPTKGLAPADVDTVVAALRDLKLQGATILMVDQTVAVVRALADVCVGIDAGRITWQGTPADLDADPSLRTRLPGLTLGDAA